MRQSRAMCVGIRYHPHASVQKKPTPKRGLVLCSSKCFEDVEKRCSGSDFVELRLHAVYFALKLLALTDAAEVAFEVEGAATWAAGP